MVPCKVGDTVLYRTARTVASVEAKVLKISGTDAAQTADLELPDGTKVTSVPHEFGPNVKDSDARWQW